MEKTVNMIAFEDFARVNEVDLLNEEDRKEAMDGFLSFIDRSEVGNAVRFEVRYGDRVRSVGGEWIVYDGKAWRRNKSHIVKNMMIDTIESIKNEADHLPQSPATEKGESEASKHRKFSVQSSTDRKIDASLKIAAARLHVEPTIFDRRRELLNTPSGVVDLTTGDVIPHNPNLLMTGVTAVEYDKDADKSGIEDFVRVVTTNKDGTPNPERAHFIKTFIGYSSYADNRERALLMITGDETDDNRNGGNGKTTLFTFISDALGGDLTSTVSKDIICRVGGRAPESKSRLPLIGRRLVYGAELSKGDIIDAASLKLITGEERIRIKELYKDEYEAFVTATPVVYSQVMPRVNEAHSAVWDRIFRVIFPVYFYTEGSDSRSITSGYSVKADKDKIAAMRKDPEFLKGVLRWIVEGAVEYHKNGLPKFNEAKESLVEVKRASDPVADFATQCLTASEGAKIKAADLYFAYSLYCALNSIEPVSQRAFGDAMTGRGFASANKSGYTYRQNVAFTPVGFALSMGDDPEAALAFTVENEGTGRQYSGHDLPASELAHFAIKSHIREGETYGPYRVVEAAQQEALDQEMVEAVRKAASNTGRRGR